MTVYEPWSSLVNIQQGVTTGLAKLVKYTCDVVHNHSGLFSVYRIPLIPNIHSHAIINTCMCLVLDIRPLNPCLVSFCVQNHVYFHSHTMQVKCSYGVNIQYGKFHKMMGNLYFHDHISFEGRSNLINIKV